MVTDNTFLLVHLCSQSEWQRAQQNGEYHADTLETTGFIHLSKPEQILKVANQYYPAARNVLLLWIDPSKLQSDLRWEVSDGDVFPHLYGALNLDAVVVVSDFPADPDGVFRTVPAIR